jgi:hypothetical protein
MHPYAAWLRAVEQLLGAPTSETVGASCILTCEC